jgi:hypothetical protein
MFTVKLLIFNVAYDEAFNIKKSAFNSRKKQLNQICFLSNNLILCKKGVINPLNKFPLYEENTIFVIRVAKFSKR